MTDQTIGEHPIAEALWISDPGHAWMRVPLESVKGLTISGYSYRDDRYAYLEEDDDATAWLLHYDVWDHAIDTQHTDTESFVRDLPRFAGGKV